MFTKIGRRRMLDAAVGNAPLGTLTQRLFVNNFTPDDDSVEEDFTEASFSGYTAEEMLNADWTDATDATTTHSTQAEITWTAGASGQTVYGTYTTNAAGEVIDYQLASAPIVLASGTQVKFTPDFSLAPPSA